MVNLDYLAAKYAFQTLAHCGSDVAKLDHCATSALNILHEQGLYAMFLWLKESSRSQQAGPAAEAIVNALDALFHDQDAPFTLATNQHLREENVVRDCLTKNLKSMFLAKNLIDLSLIYVRHSAKAQG